MELENIDIIDGATVSPLESIAEFGNLSPIPEDPDGDAIDGRSQKQVWLPNTPVSVRITHYKHEPNVKVFNPNLYTIEVIHGKYNWVVKKRYKHFRHLHEELKLFHARISIPLPTKEHRVRRKSIRTQRLSRFPLRPEAIVRGEAAIETRKDQLEAYLQSVLRCRWYREHEDTLKFLEVSHLSFMPHLGQKRKEGILNKCSGGRRISIGCCGCLRKVHFAGLWHRRWMVVKDTFVTYTNPDDGSIRDVLLMDSEFSVQIGMQNTGASHGLMISNLARHLLVQCWTDRKAEEWMNDILQVAETSASEYTKKDIRFNSFAPIRQRNYVRWFVDGASYFDSVANALERAKDEIYITDWWLSPELFLKRPVTEARKDKFRLDILLQRKAMQGVKVYILLYKEVELALGINSMHSKTMLTNAHPNIKVLRHRRDLLWAHHEKLVAIDQKVAFLGGFDICFGRWDTADHRLVDTGSVVAHDSPRTGSQSQFYFPRDHTSSAETSNSCTSHNQDETDAISQHVNASSSTHHSIKKPSQSDEICYNNNEVRSAVHPSQSASNSTVSHEGQSDTSNVESGTSVAQTNNSLSEEVNDNNELSSPLRTSPTQDSESLYKEIRLAYTRTMSVDDGETREKQNSRTSFHRASFNRSISEGTPSSIKSEPPTEAEATAAPSRDEGDGGGRARRRWRLVLNVKKLDNIHTQMLTRSNIDKPSATPPPASSNPEQNTPPTRNKFMSNFRRGKAYDTSITEDRPGYGISQLSNDEALRQSHLQGSRLWIGKDYSNFIQKDFYDLHVPFEDGIDRTQIPRIPWHDIGAVVYGKAAQDVSRHFICRWNFTKLEKGKYNPAIPFLLPKVIDDSMIPQAVKENTYRACCQILRSAHQWSAGIKLKEDSIHQAYITSIENAKHFIYIENQFFISIGSTSSAVVNNVAEAIFKRIVQAHRDKKLFRVYVMMPLLPGFEGKFGTSDGVAIQAITHWNYMSICRGGHSLIERLLVAVGDPLKYISFYSLRTHDVLMDKLVTELIYVHSKMMIVDDDTVIIGSANINDRSMLGERDSELAIIVQDTDKFTVHFNGIQHQAGRFASTLRKNLFREHLGLTIDDQTTDISDPVSDNFYKGIWIRQASINTRIYNRVFHCIPDDTILTFSDLRAFEGEPRLVDTDPQKTRQLLSGVKGHLVLLPLHFLRDENLEPPIGTKEQVLPSIVWK